MLVELVCVNSYLDVNETCCALLRIHRKIPSRAESFLCVLQALTDAFLCIDAGGNVEQALKGFGMLHDDRCRPLHRGHRRSLPLSSLLHKVTLAASFLQHFPKNSCNAPKHVLARRETSTLLLSLGGSQSPLHSLSPRRMSRKPHLRPSTR